jgi:probable HAF family extracellular repeat protein
MLRICNRCALVALCLVTLVATGAARARSLVFITIDFPGAISTNAQGINAQGEIVGGYTDTGGRAHGFLLTGGQFQSIDVPNARATLARGIGPGGDIVGSYVSQVETTNVPAHPPGLLPRHGHDGHDAWHCPFPSRMGRDTGRDVYAQRGNA